MAYPVQLQTVSANQAVYWVINSFKTFFTQPLMLGGLVFMSSAILQLLLAFTPIGLFLALLLVPAFNIAAMAAMEDATHGRMAKPNRILTAFKGGKNRIKAVAALGGFYILGIILLSILTYLTFSQEIEQFAKTVAQNISNSTTTATSNAAGSSVAASNASAASARLNPDNLGENILNLDNGLPNFLIFMMVCSVISSLAFWHAPTLVFWYGVKPYKALVFSLLACIKNIKAMLVYAACWLALIAPMMFISNAITSSQGPNSFLSFLLMPLMMVLSAVLVLSNYFTFKGTFVQHVELTTPES
jgi:hypothetical protein